jgi:hypothetical protein
LLMLGVSPLNIQMLKGKVIPATKLWCTRPTGTFHTCSPSPSRPLMKIAAILPDHYLQNHVVDIENKCFQFLSYPEATHLCEPSVRFWSMDSRGMNHQFLIKLTITIITTLYIWRPMLHCCYWPSSLSVFFITAWRVMVASKARLNSTNLINQKFEKVKMATSRFPRRKSQLFFQGIICKTMLLITKNWDFRFLPCPRTIYFCKRLVRFSWIDPRPLDGQYLILLHLMFRFTLCI